MSTSPSDDPDHRSRSYTALDTRQLSVVHDDLPDQWTDGDVVYYLRRIDATSWKVALDGVVLGILSHVPPDVIGEPTVWRISDPFQQALGIGASWSSWQDAVANLVDYRRRH